MDDYVFNPDDLNDDERHEFDLMVVEEMLKLENSLKQEEEQQQKLKQQHQQLTQQQQQKQQQIQQPLYQQQQQYQQKSYSNSRYDINDTPSKDSEYNSLAFGNPSNRRPTPPSQKSEEMMNRKTKQNEYARQLEEDRLAQLKHTNSTIKSNRNVTDSSVSDVPMAMRFGRDTNTEYQIKKDKQALYLQQLNAQQISNQKVKESELAFAFSVSDKPKPQSPLAYNQNEIPFRFARTRGPHNELVDEAETKKFKQKVYMDEIKSSRNQQPINTERVSLRSLGRNNKGIEVDDEPAFGASSLINSIGGNFDDDRTKRMKQQAYAKQLQDSSSLPPIYTERISLNSHSEVKKRRELMEIASNDTGSVDLANLARHVASDFYGNETEEAQPHKVVSDTGSFLATGLSSIGPNTAYNNKRQQQQQYAKALEMDAIKKNEPIYDDRVSLKEYPVRRDPSNTTLRLNSHDISTTDRLESERFKREEYVLLSEQDKYRNPIPSSRAPIIRASSPSGGMTGLSIGDDEAKRMLEKEKKLNYSRQLANDAKQKPIEVERVPLSPRLRKQMALKLHRKEQEEAINPNHIVYDSMDIATAQQLEQRERLRRPLQSDHVKDSNENTRMKSLLTQYEVPSKSSIYTDIQTNNGYPQQRGNSSGGGGDLQWSINPVDAAERQAAMRINRLGNNQEYSKALRDQMIQLSARKDPYDYSPKESPRDHYSSILLGLPTNWARGAPIESRGRYTNTHEPSYHRNDRETYNMNLPNPTDLDARAIEILKQRQGYINNNNPNESLYFGTQQQQLIIPKDYSY